MDSALERFTPRCRPTTAACCSTPATACSLPSAPKRPRGRRRVRRARRAGASSTARATRPVRREHGVPDFNVRVGIHTGRVLLGGGVDAEGSIRGARSTSPRAWSRAHRRAGCASATTPGATCAGCSSVEAQPPISVKGVAQPLGSYLVGRARPRSLRACPRGVEGVATPMVGREAELALLLLRLRAHGQRAAQRSPWSARPASARAGCWPSSSAGSRARPAGCCSAGPIRAARSHPFGLLHDLLLRTCRSARTSRADGPRKLGGALAPLLADEGLAPVHLLGHLIGMDFSASVHVKACYVTRRGCASALSPPPRCACAGWASRGPVVLVLDDLHWADPGSHRLRAPRHARGRRRTAVVPDADAANGVRAARQWMRIEPRHTRLDLKPLDHAHSQELAGGLLQRIADVPEALRALVIDGAEGNPFYMEELVKMLIDDGVIVVERWLARAVGQAAARARAADADRRAASTAGRTFRRRAPRAAAGGGGRARVLGPGARRHRPGRAAAAAAAAGQGADRGTGESDRRRHQRVRLQAPPVCTRSPTTACSRRRSATAMRVSARSGARVPTPPARGRRPGHCRALAEAQYHSCQADPQDYVGWFEHQFATLPDAYAPATLRPLVEQMVEVCERHFGAEHPETARALTKVARVAAHAGAS